MDFCFIFTNVKNKGIFKMTMEKISSQPLAYETREYRCFRELEELARSYNAQKKGQEKADRRTGI